MPLVKHINSIGSFFNAMGERGNRYTYDGIQFILDYYDSPDYGYVQLDPIEIVSTFREYYCLRDYCGEVFNGDQSILDATEYLDLDDKLSKVLADIEEKTQCEEDSIEFQASILQSSGHLEELVHILETKPEFTCSKGYAGTAYVLKNGSIMFVCA